MSVSLCSTSGLDVRYKFTGKERDTETNYDYFGARYYDSRIARWLQVDPLEGEDLGWSPYNYVRNNPVNKIDPDGKFWDTIIDVVSVGYSAYELIKNPSWENAGYLAADIGGAALPFIPSLGSIKLGAKLIENSDKIADVGKTAQKDVKLLSKEAGPVGHISPSEVHNKTPKEINQKAKELGLNEKGADPMHGKGAYVDPKTGKQRILSHPNGENPHAHVNDPQGKRVDKNGNIVNQKSKDAHIPIKKD